MSHRFPEHRSHITLHFHRNCQDHSSFLYRPRYRYVLRTTRRTLRPKDLEYFG